MHDIIRIYNKKIVFITINELGITIKKRQIELDYVSYEDIKKNFPKNFNPIAIYFSFPEYYFIPIGLENLECVTFALVSDWNLNFLHLKETIKVFDYILTDLKGVKIFKENGLKNVHYFPLFGLQVDGYENFLNDKKIYDISFIGNLNDNIQVERAKYLYKVSKLSYKYQVNINSNIYGDDYKKIMCESKIIFNLSIRSELNIRVYEAMNSNSLLFLEDSNLEANKFLKDNFHYVSYNKNNLEEKIDFYLSNDLERKRIIFNAHNYVKKHNIVYFENKLFSLILKKEFSKKTFINNNLEESNLRILIGALNTVNKTSTNKLLNQSFDIKNSKISNLELCRKYFINTNINILIEEFKKEIESFKDYIPLKVNLIYILFTNNEFDNLNKIIDNLIFDLENKIYSLDNLSGFFINEIYTRFKVEYEKNIALKNIESIQSTILWNIYKIKSEVCKDISLKIEYLLKADKIFDCIEIKLKLGDLFYDIDINQSYQYYVDSLKINPFNLELIYKIDIISDFLNINYIDREYLDIIESSDIFKSIYNDIKDFSIKIIKRKIELIKKYSNNKKIINHLLIKIPENIPEDKGLIENLGEIYIEQNNFKKALEIYTKLLKLTINKDSNILDKIKFCLKNLGDNETLRKIN